MKQDRDVLAEHGTELMVLKPSSIVQAAQADIRRCARNVEIGAPTIGHTLIDSYQPYAFHRKHVRRATDAVDLMRMALMDSVCGEASAKYNTRLIYGNPALILAALKLAAEMKDGA